VFVVVDEIAPLPKDAKLGCHLLQLFIAPAVRVLRPERATPLVDALRERAADPR
jgi:hypothetical protein